MNDPANYEVLLRNVQRLFDDAEFAFDGGRWQMAYAMSVYTLEEAAKYTQLVGGQRLSKGRASMHTKRQELIGYQLRDTAIFEAFWHEVPELVERLGRTDPELHDMLKNAPRKEVALACAKIMASDPTFDMDKFLRRILGDDPTQTFAADATTDAYHRKRQQCFHADYDNGVLTANPFDITEADAREVLEIAWLAAKMQTLWKDSWARQLANGAGIP